ncbi:hypothetical protein W01_08980 [Candidatus Nitrotoga sp. AM1P]|nr:hypothetical protein W01_08980 [Candidatus Nitrotoga sp. AM1P]
MHKWLSSGATQHGTQTRTESSLEKQARRQVRPQRATRYDVAKKKQENRTFLLCTKPDISI